MSTKALKLIQSNKSTEERASTYSTRIATSLRTSVLDVIQDEIHRMEDKIFDLENINIQTDLNAGQSELSKESIERRFKEIMDLRYDIDLKKAKLKSYQQSYDTYFKDERPNVTPKETESYIG